MRTHRGVGGVLGVLLTLCLSAGGLRAADDPNAKAGTKDKDKETVTVVHPTATGDVVVISKEQTTTVEVKPAPKDEKKAEAAVAPAAEPTDTGARKARIAVVPAVFTPELRRRWESELLERFKISETTVLENLQYTNYLIDALVNCRKFDVMERENLSKVTKELDFGESDYADAAKVVKIGQMLNADYMVVPEIRYIGFYGENKDVPYVGKTEARVQLKLAMGVRMVAVKTSKIASSNISEVEKKARLKPDKAMGTLGQVRELVDGLYADSAVLETARIIDVAYPIRVVAVAAATCVLNRGRGAVSVGEEMEVYKPGEALVDPDTKENLGYQEERVGRVTVVKVEEKTCTAQIVEGAGAIQRLGICRRVKAPAAKDAQPVLKVE